MTAFTITADGSLTDRHTWAELGKAAVPDGICLDAGGAVWYAEVPNRHCRRVAEGGQVLDTVDQSASYRETAQRSVALTGTPPVLTCTDSALAASGPSSVCSSR